MNSRQVQTAILVASEVLVTVATLVIVARLIGGQDGVRTIKMKAAHGLENLCMDNAKMWADLASVMSSVYDKSRVASL